VIETLLLALVQGITEFLPISSSGHLVIGQRLLGIEGPGLALQAALHLGTSLSVLVVFRRDVWRLLRCLGPGGIRQDRRTVLWLVLASIPVAAVGLGLGRWIEPLYGSLLSVGLSLLLTGGILVASDRAARRAEGTAPGGWRALAVGVAQAAALLPGISRSGVTIAVGTLLGSRPMAAARFSFLLSLPAVIGAGGMTLSGALRASASSAEPILWLLVGGAVAAAVGVAALRLLLAVVARSHLSVFGVYCLALGAAVLLWTLLA